MQNLPDKGVSGFDHYLQADRTVTGLSGTVYESQEKNGRNRRAFPFWDTVRQKTHGYLRVRENSHPWLEAGIRNEGPRPEDTLAQQ
jgi:hypothetical protein